MMMMMKVIGRFRACMCLQYCPKMDHGEPKCVGTVTYQLPSGHAATLIAGDDDDVLSGFCGGTMCASVCVCVCVYLFTISFVRADRAGNCERTSWIRAHLLGTVRNRKIAIKTRCGCVSPGPDRDAGVTTHGHTAMAATDKRQMCTER